MIEEFKSVQDFITQFKQGKNISLYHQLINEEATELINAESLNDQYKEAADLIYVVMGEFVSLGLDPDKLKAAFQVVHESNMSKLSDSPAKILQWIGENQLNAELGKTPSGYQYFAKDTATGKVLKGPNYKPPQIDV